MSSITDHIKGIWNGAKDFSKTDTGKVTIIGGLFTLAGVGLSTWFRRRDED